MVKNFGNVFPYPREDNIQENGLLCWGGLINGKLPASLLLEAYSKCIFPWYEPGSTPLWFCPNPRAFILPEKLHVNKSFSKVLRNRDYCVKTNSVFEQVLHNCSSIPRAGSTQTWISAEIKEALLTLHQKAWAHSVEVFEPSGNLVGGLYGVKIGQMFFGESMFSLSPDASKIALAALCLFSKELDVSMIDCQMKTDHLATMGAQTLPRNEFIEVASFLMDKPDQKFELSVTNKDMSLKMKT